ncbi:MAG: hypothetical protein JOZ42_15935 [Acetobacteraceae bacterium]|nr:hypothetical protein [Acetobacteraceae bacterium]
MAIRGAGLGLAAAVMLAAATGSPARAQMDTREGIALQNQILELRRDLQNLQNQPGRGAPAVPPGGSFLGAPGRPVPLTPGAGFGGGADLTAQLLDRVSALEEQVRTLRGRVDELSNQVQNQGQDLSKQVGDLNFRMRSSEGGRGGIAAAPPPVAASPQASPPPAVPPPGPPPPRRPETALQEGRASLARHDYAGAEAAARDVLANNRTSPRAYDAQYLLAEALAGRQNWSQAAIAYDDTYSRARTGSHAQEALLGLSNSLIGLGDKRAGCAALAKLQTEFANPKPELRDQMTATRQRGGC